MKNFVAQRQKDLTNMIELPLAALALKYADTIEKLEFGDASFDITHEWPTKDVLKKKLDKKINLNQIQYKIFGNSNNTFTGMGLTFTTLGSSFIETTQGKSDS